MTIKPLLVNQDVIIHSTAQWERKREDIKKRLFATIGEPPFARNTRSLKILSEEILEGYIRRKISYEVGMGESVTAYLLQPDGLEGPVPAILEYIR